MEGDLLCEASFHFPYDKRDVFPTNTKPNYVEYNNRFLIEMQRFLGNITNSPQKANLARWEFVGNNLDIGRKLTVIFFGSVTDLLLSQSLVLDC